MFKITNNSTTYLAVENVNLAPCRSTEVAVITESLQYLEHKGAIKIEPLKEQPKRIEAPVSTPMSFMPKFKKEKK